MHSPHFKIDTIAAGGGSKLKYENGMLIVGPESVGSNPGPVCYGIGSNYEIIQINWSSLMSILS
jgi:5-oxoprolinase (ATP-hydrolysing)